MSPSIKIDESKGWIAFDGRKKFVNYAVLAKRNNDAWAMIQNTIHLLHLEDDPSRYLKFVEFYHLQCKLLLKEKRFKNLLSSSCAMEQYNYLIYKEWGEHLYRKVMESYKTAKEHGWEATKPTREKASLRWQLKDYQRPTKYPPEFLVSAPGKA
ncbi:MAG: hypothetical protein JRF28_10685, partial [Deltaproteobacteria bacterium]|nr:hypothetical protein [Deltaproteobacteria bacterium]